MGHNGDGTPKKCEGSAKPQRKKRGAKQVPIKGNGQVFTFFRTLKKSFEWTAECQQAFEELKAYLSSPPLLSPSQLGEELFLYLAVSPAIVSKGTEACILHQPRTSRSRIKIPIHGETRLCISYSNSQTQAVLSRPHGSRPDRQAPTACNEQP